MQTGMLQPARAWGEAAQPAVGREEAPAQAAVERAGRVARPAEGRAAAAQAAAAPQTAEPEPAARPEPTEAHAPTWSGRRTRSAIPARRGLVVASSARV